MFDGNFREAADKVTGPIGAWLVRRGVTADVLTATGVVAALATAVTIATGHTSIGVALFILAALPDLLDGQVAKASGTQSIRGSFFDSVSDRITDALILGGLTWHLMSTRDDMVAMLPVALLGVSQLISYERAKAEVHGFDAKGGLMERAERVVVLCFAIAIAPLTVPLLWLMLALTTITAITRFAKVWRQATDLSPVLSARRRETRPLVRNLFNVWTEADERRRRRWREWADIQRQTRRRSRNR